MILGLVPPAMWAVLIVATLVAAAMCYVPAPISIRRRAIRGGVSRLVPRHERDEITRPPGRVELRAHRPSWLSPQPWHLPRRARLFVYLGPRPPRFGGLSLLLNSRRYITVTISGADFEAAIGPARLWWRPLDGALAVAADYSGPAAVTDGTSPTGASTIRHGRRSDREHRHGV